MYTHVCVMCTCTYMCTCVHVCTYTHYVYKCVYIHTHTHTRKVLKNKIETESLGQSLKAAKVKVKKLDNQRKNRGRELKKLRSIRDKCKSFLPQKKLKDNVTSRALRLRRQRFRERTAIMLHEVAEAHKIHLPNYGELEIKCAEDIAGNTPSIILRKGSSLSERMQKFLKLHDTGMSKRKIHECRMLCNGVPPLHRINEEQKRLDDEVIRMFRITHDKVKFLVHPEDVVKYAVIERGLPTTNDEIHMIVEGDGRQSGYLDTVVMSARFMNDGRAMHKENKSYLLALVKGKEGCGMVRDDLKQLREELRELQENGVDIDLPSGERKHYRVLLHLLSDGKFMKIIRGMTGFNVNGCNCLFCCCHSSKRGEVFNKWDIDSTRWDRVDRDRGCLRPDLFSFIPLERQWLECMHLVLRFLMDRLIVSGWTDIVNDEFDSSEEGMRFIEDQMRGEDIKIASFRMFGVGRCDDPTAEKNLSWTGLSFTQVLTVADEFDFVAGHPKHPEKGKLLQESINKFKQGYSELVVWPGDGPVVSKEATFQANSAMLGELVGVRKPDDSASDSSSDDCEPGELEHRDDHFPLTTITPYGHVFCAHIGELYERSKKYACYFVTELWDLKPNRGGLKFALTQALERSNLDFFHRLFQTLDKRTDALMHRAGMQMMRVMINPAVIDRARYHCIWCARGFVHKARHSKHEANCKQMPSFDEAASIYLAAERSI